MSKPNWKSTRSIHGGKFKDLGPGPHVRRFPHKGLKRQVEVRITTWVGTCAGARHYIPSIEEEKNPVWDSKENAWRSAWDDLESIGTRIEGPRLLSEKDAKEWIQWKLRAFDPKTHEFVFLSGLTEESPKWFYAHEGD